MYQSPLDPLGKLTFAFDPFRLLHARKDSELDWPEYPFKQVLIDRVQTRTKPSASAHATAAALLLAHGDETRALFELQQCVSDALIDETHATSNGSDYEALEQRFLQERAAFRAAKVAFLKAEKAKVQTKLDVIARNDREQAEQEAHEAWKRRQIVKRFEDGSKYDGDGVNRNNVLIPHGQGALWVPEKESALAESANIKRVPRYIGAWMDGFMHGHGTYYWLNGDSWEGSFIRDEMQGKGVFLPSISRDSDDDDEDNETARPTTSNGTPVGRRVRYFDASQHVCWGDELVAGCRLFVASNRHFGDPLVTAVKRCNVDLEVETEYVIVSYDEKADRFLVRKGETEQTRWLSLQNTSFRVARSRPITRWSPE